MKDSGDESLDSASSSDSDHYGAAVADDDDATAPETILADRSLFTRYIDTGLGAELQKLPLRFLAPGSVTDLWKDCCANHHNVSYSSFNRCWKSFQGCLRFRNKGDFVDCDQCTALKLEIKKSRKHYSALIRSSQALQNHYKNVSKSRDIEEALRSLPPTCNRPVLFLTTDGMDQSFWSIPRLQHWRGPKQMGGANVRRPRCKVQGCWAFFHGVHMFIADSVQPHDASMTCECVARVLEQCKVFASKKGQRLPPELVVMTDNTCRENKCTTFMLYLASLQARGMFSSVSFIQHIKGHTHTIMDQLFGVVSRSFQFCDHLPDVYAVAKEVEAILRRETLKQFFCGAEVCVSVLESCRDWASYMGELGISIQGGLRLDLTSNHCFVWMYRALTKFGRTKFSLIGNLLPTGLDPKDLTWTHQSNLFGYKDGLGPDQVKLGIEKTWAPPGQSSLGPHQVILGIAHLALVGQYRSDLDPPSQVYIRYGLGPFQIGYTKNHD